MPADSPPVEKNDENLIQWEFKEVAGGHMFLDVTLFLTGIKSCYEAINSKVKRAHIQKLLSAEGWIEHYLDKKTGRRVLSESKVIEHDHERLTAICLAQMNYDVLFAPDGMFKRNQKKFDVYLLRDTIILEADLKCIYSVRPDTIANRIKSCSDQASRVISDIRSDINIGDLIDGLRSGAGKNSLLKEVFLFYKNRFYILPKDLIWSKRIYQIPKSEKGYT